MQSPFWRMGFGATVDYSSINVYKICFFLSSFSLQPYLAPMDTQQKASSERNKFNNISGHVLTGVNIGRDVDLRSEWSVRASC